MVKYKCSNPIEFDMVFNVVGPRQDAVLKFGIALLRLVVRVTWVPSGQGAPW